MPASHCGLCGHCQPHTGPSQAPPFGQAYNPDEFTAAGGAAHEIPLGMFGPQNRVRHNGNSLVIQERGVYEISYGATVSHEFGNTIVGLFAAVAGTTEPIPPTLSDWWAMPTSHIQSASKTAFVCLPAGTRLSLMVRSGQPGTLIVSPGATLTVRRIGDC